MIYTHRIDYEYLSGLDKKWHRSKSYTTSEELNSRLEQLRQREQSGKIRRILPIKLGQPINSDDLF